MNELKPEDVMRALECCDTKGNCNQCPYEILGQYTICYGALTQDALALLREKDAKIERLRAEIGRLGEQCRVLTIEYPKTTRAEAITEFEERLERIGTPLMHTYVVTRMDIKQVVKDMKEEQE